MTDLRAIPSSFSQDVVSEIDRRLAGVCANEAVAIPLAVESGSRAWGFPSPDSDYDCRFVFVRPVDQHLSPWPKRDVIETPLDAIFDVNGWELGKAIKLLLKGNAVILEWLRSPTVYRGEAWFRDAMLDFADRHASRELLRRHYLHLGERQRLVHFSDEKSVPQKKIFYAVRPAAALRWLRLHPNENVPPMNFLDLMRESDVPAGAQACIDDLLSRKAISHEMGAEPVPAVISSFIDQEFELARQSVVDVAASPSASTVGEAETLYRTVVARCF